MDPPLKKGRIGEPMGSTQQNVDSDHVARARKMRFIPPEIIFDILSRLSGSVIIRFRLVCKLWFSMTHDSRFLGLHLERSSKVYPPHIIIFSRGEEKHGEQKFHLTALDETWKPIYKLSRDSDGLLCTPPCNGLLCLYDFRRNIKLCNPLTQEFLSLPRPTIDSRGVRNSFPKCSFGFHPVTKEYKVVRFFYRFLNHKTEIYDLGCEVFTLGSSSWKYIGSINWYLTGHGINIDGYLYWTTGANSMIPDRIVGLDLKDEKFRIILPPVYGNYKVEVDGPVFLVQLEGNLCLVHVSSRAPGSMDIWMLEDYTNSIWVHRCSIPIFEYSQWHPEPIIIHKGKQHYDLYLWKSRYESHEAKSPIEQHCQQAYWRCVHLYPFNHLFSSAQLDNNCLKSPSGQLPVMQSERTYTSPVG